MAGPLFPFIDGHVDLLYDMMRRCPGRPLELCDGGSVQLRMLTEGGVKVLGSALYCPDTNNGPETSSAFIHTLLEYAETYLGSLRWIRSGSELKECFEKPGPPGFFHLIENADGLLELDLKTIKELGIRLVGLTHAGGNRLGDGNGVPSPSGLTAAGKRLVRDLSSMGFAIDTAHLSDPCFRDLLDLFEGPLCSSHTGFRHFSNIPRNLADWQVEELVRRDGVIGITINPEMLLKTGLADMETVIHQIDRLVQKHGPGCAAVGSDYGGFDPINLGLEHPGRLRDLAHSLVLLGYSEEAVRMICGENWFRFLLRLM